jgi:malonyl-CoA O-methyltransferase
MLSAVDGHRLWAPTYDADANPLIALERRAMGNLLQPLRRVRIPWRVLDIACGTGYWKRRLEQDGAVAFGCDACQEMLPTGGRVAVGDAECLPFAAAIADLVVCSLALGYFRRLGNVFGEMKRILRPGGYLAISDLHPAALRSGWKRSFRVEARVFEIEHFVRDVDEVKSAAARSGLELQHEQDAYFGIEELPIFKQAKRAESFAATSNLPALFLALWKKPC